MYMQYVDKICGVKFRQGVHMFVLSIRIIGNRFKKSICLFLNPIVELLLFCLYMSVIPIKYVYTKHKNKV